MHAISNYRGNRPTNKLTHTNTRTNPQTGPITIHCAAASLARSVMTDLRNNALDVAASKWKSDVCERADVRNNSDITTNNNRVYIAPYGRNFRGAGGKSGQCSVKAWENKKNRKIPVQNFCFILSSFHWTLIRLASNASEVTTVQR